MLVELTVAQIVTAGCFKLMPK